jgi:DNA polymerase III subunit delta'
MTLGHARAWETLLSALARDQLHHALLFEGPRGVGKRTLANALARAANCERSDAGRPPCGECPVCASFGTGSHPDLIVLEPDTDRAARTIPIEAVREVIRQTQYHRYSARKRFVIIDPAEAMQEPAANALLKTLEEPPQGTHFVLITHNARALLPTIVSRCQRVRLGAVPEEEIRSWLVQQGFAEVAGAAARLAQGCPGRGRELAENGLSKRTELREALLLAVSGSLQDVYEFSAKVTAGARQEWSEEVGRVLEVVEDLVRDAAILATSAAVAKLDQPEHDVVHRLARDDLEVYVTGKTALDALLTAVRRELSVAG